MKKILLGLSLCLGLCHATAVKAQDAAPVDTAAASQSAPALTIVERVAPGSGSTVIVEAPQALMQRLLPSVPQELAGTPQEPKTDKAEEGDEAENAEATQPARPVKAVGYRVQVYADNNARTATSEARQRERAVGQAFPDMATYVTYASPYWRLRVGNFRSSYEAEKAAADIRKAFPRYAREVRVVRDKVTLGR